MARLTQELGFVYFVNDGKRCKSFADKDEAERYYKRVVEREERHASDRKHKRENKRERKRVSTSDSN